MNMKFKNSWIKHADFMVIDQIVLTICFALSYRKKFGDYDWINQPEWISIYFLVSIMNVLLTIVLNPYSGILRRPYHEDVLHSLKLSAYNLLIGCVVFYLFKAGVVFSREMMLQTYLSYFIISLVMKVLWKRNLFANRTKRSNENLIPLFVVSESATIENAIRDVLAADFQSYEIVGWCDENGVDTLVQQVMRCKASEVFLASPPHIVSKETYRELMVNGIRVNIATESLMGIQSEFQNLSQIGVYRVVSLGDYSFSSSQLFYLIIKRVFDIVCALIGLLVLLPITIVIKIVYLVNGDTTPLFFTQKRIGLHGKPIYIYKFRSMVPNAEEMLKEMLKDEKYRTEWEKDQKFENDPRITPIGNILRRTSLDELPQLVNVLKGDMSLVGPRPLIDGELEAHGGLKLYNLVKPGITGWWGCNGRSNIDYRERLELEYFYIKNFSIYLDVLCIMRTIKAVLLRTGSK